MNLDIGGQKHRRDMGGSWKVLDSRPEADFVHLLGSGPLPFKDGQVDNIYSSHTLEHVEPRLLGSVLSQFHRVLRAGGTCRVVVPNCAYAVKLYLKNPGKLSDKRFCSKPKFMPNTPMAYLTSWFHTDKDGRGTGHKIGFDDDLLVAFFREAGFSKFSKMSFNHCSDQFRGKDYERYAEFSLYYEFIRT